MRHLLALAAFATLAACVAPSAPPPQPVPPVAAPTPAPPPAPVPAPPASSDWRDWSATPGGWTWRAEAAGPVAIFGTGASPVFTLRCDRAARQIVLTRVGASASALTVRTSSTARSLAAASGSAALPANDPLFDAMGYSRGRFIVETQGAPPLVIPAWAEVLRVTEDCRR